MESQPWAFKDTAPKGGNYEEQRKNESSRCQAHNGLWYLGEQGRGINKTPGPWNDTIKEGRQPKFKGKKDHNRIIEENLVKTHKSRKRERHFLVSQTAIIEHTWIQRDSNFASLRGLNSHLSL